MCDCQTQMIQPFILRRSKRDVEKQLPKKYEHILKCRLSSRQKSLYEDILTQPGWDGHNMRTDRLNAACVSDVKKKITLHCCVCSPDPKRPWRRATLWVSFRCWCSCSECVTTLSWWHPERTVAPSSAPPSSTTFHRWCWELFGMMQTRYVALHCTVYLWLDISRVTTNLLAH